MPFLILTLFLLGLVFSVFVGTPFGLGLCMLVCSMILSLIISSLYHSWFSIIFFLVFVGGLLVLFFYVLSLSYKPAVSNFVKLSKFSVMGSGVLGGWLVTKLLFCGELSKFTSKKSFKLFNSFESVLNVFLACFLLGILWVISKIIFKVSGGFRPKF